MYKVIATSLMIYLTINNAVFAAEEKESKKVMISPGIYSIDVMHNGERVTIKREQNRKNIISKYYQPTHRGKIQPIRPFEPHAVETIGTLEMIDYLKQLEDKGDSIIIIDSRTKAWVKRGTIPGTVIFHLANSAMMIERLKLWKRSLMC